MLGEEHEHKLGTVSNKGKAASAGWCGGNSPAGMMIISRQSLAHSLKDPIGFHDAESGLPPIAGLILESVQGEGGVIPAPASWLREIAAIAHETSTALILDEVQTGWGPTGTLYAFEHSGIVPDVLVLSKAIGGSLPLAVIVYRGALDVWPPGAHAGTFRGADSSPKCNKVA
jgi:4-aminobutyrate aminotransferase-like enzyme